MQLKNLNTNFLGKNIIYYKQIDSTQKEIERLIQNKKISNGTIVIADVQTEAIGTHGRKWYTDQTNNIAFSIFIKMDCKIEKIDGITIEIAKIIVEVLKEKYGIELQIKYPNDITFNNKKIGGILTQAKIKGSKVKYLIIGIGINTNQQKFRKDIENIATSIKEQFNIEIDTKDFIVEFCNKFEEKVIKRMED